MKNWPRAIARGVRDFCRTSSLHGIAYVADGPALKALAWFVAVTVSISFAATFILSAIEEFSVSKVITTVGKAELSVTNIQVF